MRFITLLCLAALALPAQTPRKDRHVVIISIDGFAAYALKDETIPLPNLRRLAAQGAVADAMIPVNPTVTWPNHTSIITGVTPARHSVIYNGLASRATGAGVPVKVEPWADKKDMVLSPTLYDRAFEAGLTTGEIDWVAIFNAPTVTYSFAEVPKADAACVKEMVAAGALTSAQVAAFGKQGIVYRDELWTQAAEHMIEKHKVNLLMFHLLTTDSAQHSYGARSLGAATALSLADSKVGRVLDSIRRAGIQDSTTVFIVSDHGFKTYHNVIRPNALLAGMGLGKDVFVVPEGGTAMVYISPSRRAELAPKLRESFAKVTGVSGVIGPEEYARLGYPDPAKSDRMADLVLAAGNDYAFEGAANGDVVAPVQAGRTPGAHGYLNSDPDLNAIFIASGAGIRPGVKLPAIRNLDVAPTAASLLGLQLGAVEGKVLTSILRD